MENDVVANNFRFFLILLLKIVWIKYLCIKKWKKNNSQTQSNNLFYFILLNNSWVLLSLLEI
jgi:hypothetical protein